MNRRATELAGRVGRETPNPTQKFRRRFRFRGPDRSPFAVLGVSGAVGLGGIVALLLWLGADVVNPPPAARELTDARWASDYRNPPATGWELLDDRRAVVVTEAGAFHGRLDSLAPGVWEDLDDRRTSGVLGRVPFRQVVADEHRVWFVTSDGGLRSSDRGLRDWRVHLGAGGFVPGLDLARDATYLAVVPGARAFVVGAPAVSGCTTGTPGSGSGRAGSGVRSAATRFAPRASSTACSGSAPRPGLMSSH